jgi:hypothetical protein
VAARSDHRGAQQGRYGFNYGLVFDKAITMGHGQCPVKRDNVRLRDLIIRGKVQPLADRLARAAARPGP